MELEFRLETFGSGDPVVSKVTKGCSESSQSSISAINGLDLKQTQIRTVENIFGRLR